MWFKKLLKFRKKDTKVIEEKYDIDDIDSLFEALRTTASKLKRQQEHLDYVEKLKVPLDDFLSLEEDVQTKLKNYALKYRDSVDERRKLQPRLIRNNPALHKLVAYENQLPHLIRDIKSASKLIKTYTHNIDYLKEEKENLIEEREVLLTGYDFLKKFSIVFLICLAISFVLIVTLMQVLRENIWFYIAGLCITFSIFIPLLVFTKEKLEKEIRKNGILQQKAAKYIKKYQIHYFQQKNYVDYEFKKLGVDSIEKLETYYERYISNKDHEVNYNKHKQNMIITEKQISEILGDNKFDIKSIEVIQEWLINPHKLEEAKALVGELASMKKQLNVLQEYEQELFKQVLTYAEEEQYKDMIERKLEDHAKWTEDVLNKDELDKEEKEI